MIIEIPRFVEGTWAKHSFHHNQFMVAIKIKIMVENLGIDRGDKQGHGGESGD